MSKIKVFVRVRPPLKGEFDTPGCVNCTELEDVSGNWIHIKKEGEQKRYFARVWGPLSQQEEIFRTVGVNTVNDVLEGYYGCIFVYGQTGTGKTFTLGCLTPGLEGIQPQCLRFLFDKIARESAKYEVTVQQQYVQLYRDAIQDLLDITKDNLRIRVDEKSGAVLEKVTTRTVNSFGDAISLIEEGDKNRVTANTKMNSASSRSHACLITDVIRKERVSGTETRGRLYLIDLAGSERVSKSGVTDEAFREAVAINQSLTTLGNCIAALVNNSKMVSFRESKLTQLLQHSLTGHGRTSIVVTVRPDSPNMQETLCTLKFGERAQKVETQMTPASYQEKQLELESIQFHLLKEISEHAQSTKALELWKSRLCCEVEQQQKAVQELEISSRLEIENLKTKHGVDKENLHRDFERESKDRETAHEQKARGLRSANAGVIKEIDQKVEKALEKVRERCATNRTQLSSECIALRKTDHELSNEIEGANIEEDEDLDGQAEMECNRVREHLAVLRRKLRGCKQSRNEGLTVMELREKEEDMRGLLGRINRHRERLLLKVTAWDVEEIKGKAPAPSTQQIEEFANDVPKVAGDVTDDDESSVLPPSESPPPTDSDFSDSDIDDTTSSMMDTTTSSASSTTSASSGSSSSTAESGNDTESIAASEADTEQVELNLDQGNEHGSNAPKRKGKLREVAQRKQLDGTIKKENHLIELLEQICEYLEYGCKTYILETKDGKPSLSKSHLYLAKGRKLIAVAEYNEGGETVLKSKSRTLFSCSDVHRIVLGQFSDNFTKAIQDAPVVPKGTSIPPNCEKISNKSLPVFFYRSLSLFDKKKRTLLDVVVDQDSDFEAWMVTFHRLTARDVLWGGPLDITNAKDVHRLSDDEKKLCSDNHIPPETYLKTKNGLLHKEPRLYYGLYDIRSLSSLDLLHSQKLFDFFVKQGYIERHAVHQLMYLEKKQKEEEQRKQKEAVRELRIRIVHLVRKYRPMPTPDIQKFLKTIIGREQDTLDAIVSECGPEPTEEEVAQLEAEAAERDAKEQTSSDVTPPPPPPTSSS